MTTATATRAAQCAPVRVGNGRAVHGGSLSTDSRPGDPRYVPACHAGHRWEGDREIFPTGEPVLEPVTCRNCLKGHKAVSDSANATQEAETLATATARTLVQKCSPQISRRVYRTGQPGMWRTVHAFAPGIPCEHLNTTEQIVAQGPLRAHVETPDDDVLWEAVYTGSDDHAGRGIWGVYATGSDTHTGELWSSTPGSWEAWRAGFDTTVEPAPSRAVALRNQGWLDTLPAHELAAGARIFLPDGTEAEVMTATPATGDDSLMAFRLELTGVVLDMRTPEKSALIECGNQWSWTVDAARRVALTPPCDDCDESNGGIACDHWPYN